MEITWLGGPTVRLVSDDIALTIDPNPRIAGADSHVVAISGADPERSAAHVIRGPGVAGSAVGDAVKPRVLRGPGLYEALGYNITGLGTPLDADPESRRVNTVYLIRADGVSVCALGSLGRKLSSRQLDSLGAVDAIITEVRPEGPLSPREVAQMVNVLGARILIPLEPPTSPPDAPATPPSAPDAPQDQQSSPHRHPPRPHAPAAPRRRPPRQRNPQQPPPRNPRRPPQITPSAPPR